jgi:hypothetical protein
MFGGTSRIYHASLGSKSKVDILKVDQTHLPSYPRLKCIEETVENLYDLSLVPLLRDCVPNWVFIDVCRNFAALVEAWFAALLRCMIYDLDVLKFTQDAVESTP